MQFKRIIIIILSIHVVYVFNFVIIIKNRFDQNAFINFMMLQKSILPHQQVYIINNNKLIDLK